MTAVATDGDHAETAASVTVDARPRFQRRLTASLSRTAYGAAALIAAVFAVASSARAGTVSVAGTAVTFSDASSQHNQLDIGYGDGRIYVGDSRYGVAA